MQIAVSMVAGMHAFFIYAYCLPDLVLYFHPSGRVQHVGAQLARAWRRGAAVFLHVTTTAVLLLTSSLHLVHVDPFPVGVQHKIDLCGIREIYSGFF